MLFLASSHGPIARGEITATIRRWTRPQAKAGGRYRVGDSIIEATAVERLPFSEVVLADAQAAGFAGLGALASEIESMSGKPLGPDTGVFVVRFRLAGGIEAPPPVTDERVAAAIAKLRAMDARSEAPWTVAVLRLIRERPGTVSTELAAALGKDRFAFKTDVRKLKALGLTSSLLVGYELTDLGRAVLAAAPPAGTL